jgi:phenylacetate-coenzyme A ligase PaaK-like adenylate-forming protein
MQELRRRIGKEIRTVAGIRTTVELLKPHTLERSCGKAQRVIDKRNASRVRADAGSTGVQPVS